jgi:hypothetical protein
MFNTALYHNVDPFVETMNVKIVMFKSINVKPETFNGKCGISREQNKGYKVVKENIGMWVFQYDGAEVQNENRKPEKFPPLGKNGCGKALFSFEERENVTQNLVW